MIAGGRLEELSSHIGEMKTPAPLSGYSDAVDSEWVDYNGHMNVAYYVLAFDRATDCFFDRFGLAADYTRRGVGSVFVVDMNVSYRQELREGDAFEVAMQLLGFDEKRIHFFHEMYRLDRVLVATNEILALHVDLKRRRAGPIPTGAKTKLAALSMEHRELPLPDGVGRVIGLPNSNAMRVSSEG